MILNGIMNKNKTVATMKNLLVWTLILKLACHNPVDIRRRFRIVENFLCKSDDEGAKVQILTLQ